jgi:hypothetical protein
VADEWLDNLQVARTDPHALARLLSLDLPSDGLEHAGDAVLSAIGGGSGPPVLEDVAIAVIAALRERDWIGDRELADALAHAFGAVGSELHILVVDLDGLADALGATAAGEGFLDLRTGEVWPEGVIDAMVDADEVDIEVDVDLAEDQRLTIRGEGSREPHHDMEQFIASVDDPNLADRLRNAIHGRGASGRFTAALEGNPEELMRWNRYRDEARLGRARVWLAERGYEARPRQPGTESL